MNTTMKNIFQVIMLIVIAAPVIALVISIPVWLLWNWLMPSIFGLKTITWIQALGLAVLSRLLFKSHIGSSSK